MMNTQTQQPCTTQHGEQCRVIATASETKTITYPADSVLGTRYACRYLKYPERETLAEAIADAQHLFDTKQASLSSRRFHLAFAGVVERQQRNRAVAEQNGGQA